MATGFNQGALIVDNVLTTKTNLNISQQITDTTTARTILPTDAGNTIIFNNSGTITVSIDSNANQNLPIGVPIKIINGGGFNAILNLQIVGGSGVTLINSTNLSIGHYGSLNIVQSSTDIWVVQDVYEEFLWGATWGAIWAATHSLNSQIVRTNREVTIKFPVATFAATTPGTINNSTSALPTRFIPGTNNVNGLMSVIDNNTNTVGAYTIDTSGVITITGSSAYANFTGSSGSGNSGWRAPTLTYLL